MPAYHNTFPPATLALYGIFFVSLQIGVVVEEHHLKEKGGILHATIEISL